MKNRRRLISSLLVLLLVSAFAGVRTASTVFAATPPANFSDSLVATIDSPTALAFTPDGRILVTTQDGTLRVFQGGSLLSTPAFDLSGQLCSDFERGLLGIAVDPAFATNHFIYVYYTFNAHDSCGHNNANAPVNRISRFTLPNTNLINLSSELVLIDNIPSPNGNHNAGDLHFGKDGYLYISVGDGGCDYAQDSGCAGSNNASRDDFILLGKILRITSTGGIPADNPYIGANSARCNVTGRTTSNKLCQETFAHGLRNPFRMAFDPNAAGTRFQINDVGQDTWEEIDLGQSAADYGWNVREGLCANGSTSSCGTPPVGMTNPVFAYGRNTGCSAITAGAFVPNGVWPSQYDDRFLFGDYTCGTIFMLTPAGGGTYTSSSFVTGMGSSSIVAMTFGPYNSTQALYYLDYSSSQLRRVAYTGSANRTPTAEIAASPTSGDLPLDVDFDGSASSDLDAGDTLTYHWDFGDGTTRDTSTATTTYTYITANTYTATLTVSDNHNATSAPATIVIDAGNQPPVPQILAPTAQTLFSVGDTITLTGSASDPEDGSLADNALSWKVTLHHIQNTSPTPHTHPFMQPTVGNDLPFTAPGPEDLMATEHSYLEIALTATDSHGLSTVITQTLSPQQAALTFESDPTGLQISVNEQTVTAPATLTVWANQTLTLKAHEEPVGGGQWWVFDAWSDSGAMTHMLQAPAVDTSYTASFVQQDGFVLWFPMMRK